MKKQATKLASILVAATLGLGTGGCIKKILLDGQIASTRKGSEAVSTISDYEVARGAAMAGLAQFEGMHYLGPDNLDALFLLVKGWAGAAYGFIEDEMEQAEDLHGEDSEMAEYHRARGVAAYARAVFYGSEALESINPGLEAAQRNADTMKSWLAGFTDPEVDAPLLFWTGQAWMGRVNLLKDDPMVVAELYIGMLMLARSVELDETYNYATGHVLLGAYHTRSALAELDESKKHFDRAIELNGGKALLTKLNYAAKYYCTKVDKESYVKLLTEVVEAGDVLPEQRLQNTIAKRRARRYLGEARMKACGF